MEIVQPIRNKKQIEAMKDALNGRNKLLFIFGINSALRISDILKLRVGDVRGKTSMTIREQKTGKSKTFAFGPNLVKAIKELIPAEVDSNDWLFPSRQGGKAITRVQAYRILNDAAERIGITEAIGTHTLRKTFGYHAYKSGVDLAVLQSIFNHASQHVTLRYIGIVQDDIDDVYVSVNL